MEFDSKISPPGKKGFCLRLPPFFAVSERWKGNSISRNFIFNLVYARCQYSNCEISFLRCQLGRLGLGRSQNTSSAAAQKFLRKDHSQIFVTQWELMSKNISSDSPTQTFFALHIFSSPLRHQKRLLFSFRGSELRHLNIWWWRNARFKVLAVVVKSSGKFPTSPRITFHSRNRVHECLLVQAKL